jgi:two-component system, OmpR family, phosphate regulon response regulator PhoB
MRDALVTCLRFVGVEAYGVECAESARTWLNRDAADVLVLSEDIPSSALAEFVERRSPKTTADASILMLTRDEPPSRISLLADDAMRRPIAVSRVVERIESLIERRRSEVGMRLTFGALCLEIASSRATLGDHSLELGPIESRLLAFFMGAPEKVFSRVQLLQRVWPAKVRVEQRTVDVHIRRLRNALGELGCSNYIQTVRGSGYRFSALPVT